MGRPPYNIRKVLDDEFNEIVIFVLDENFFNRIKASVSKHFCSWKIRVFSMDNL